MDEQRRLVTVLFADIVDSTSLSDAHDPELVRATLQATFATLRELIAEHGGTVEKFIGDEVMAVFGVPVTHEDDAERAVRAAFAMRRAVAERNARSTLPLEFRFGLHSGEVVTGPVSGDMLVTGRTVAVAARVRGAAEPNEILIGASTRELTLEAVEYGDARTATAKGIGPVEVWPALSLRSDVPIHALVRRAAFVGREEELRLLQRLERRVSEDSKPFLVTILGPSGIGKTRLAAEFIDGVGPERARLGRCLPYGQETAFWPMREIIHADTQIKPTDSRNAAHEKLCRTVRSMFADGSEDADVVSRRIAMLAGLLTADEALPEVPSANRASELRWALRRYLERRTRGRPLILVFDDVQWADPALLDTIDHLAEWSGGPLLLICLARPELFEVRPRWSAGHSSATTFTLPPLSDGDAHRLIEGILPKHELPAAVREEIVRRSEGNPLFVEEFVRMLRELDETGRLAGATRDLAALVRVGLPATLHGLIASRIDRLPLGVRDALRRAAIYGDTFSAAALIAVDPARLDIAAAIAEAARRDLVTGYDGPALGEGQRYRFRHTLIREVTYRETAKADRWRMHDAAGRWIEAAAGDRALEHADLVAYHAEQAYWNARELQVPGIAQLGPRAFDRLMDAATRWRHAGLLRPSIALYERAERVGMAVGVPSMRLVEARGFAALAICYVEGARRSLARLDDALVEARGIGPSEVLVRLASQRAFMARIESLDESAHLFAEGIAAAHSTGDPELIAHATLMSNAQAWMAGDLEQHMRVLRDADAVMVESGRVAERGVALVWLAANSLQRGDFESARSYISASERNAQESGSRFQQWAATRAAARDALAMGDTEKARVFAERSLELAADVGARRLIGLSRIRLGDVLYEMGDYARSRAVLEEGLTILDPETMSETVVETQWKLSRTCLAIGDIPSARTFAQAAAANVAPTDRYSKVTTAAALAAVEAAEGVDAAAEAHYREALAEVEGTSYRALRAELQRALGPFLLSRGRPDEARPLLTAARDFYSGEGTDRRRAAIDELLTRCGAAAEAGSPRVEVG